MPTPRALARYHDLLAYVLISAPEGFAKEDYLQPDEQMTLDKAFAQLGSELSAVQSRIKDQHSMLVLRELLAMSHEAYRQGQDVRGAHILQEFEGIIWPKYKHPEEFTLEAERRVTLKQAGA